MDAVAIGVASGAVVGLGCSQVGVSSEDLGVAQRDASVQGVGDRCVTQWVWADVTGMPAAYATRSTPVDVAAVDRPS